MTQAIQYRHFGGPDVLDISTVEDATPHGGEVGVTVKAVGLNPVDWKIFSGAFGGSEPTRPRGVARDFAGIVSDIGENVTGFAQADRVFGTLRNVPGRHRNSGVLASALVLPVESILPMPDDLTFAQAASLGVPAEAASGALNTLHVNGDDVLVVSAASGGVGSIAVQLATLRGATVIGIASERNADYLYSLGAIPVSYGDALESRARAAAPRPVTKLLDCYGIDYVNLGLALGLRPTDVGTLAPTPEALGKGVLATGSRDAHPDDLSHVAALAAAGKVKVSVARTYPFDVESVRQAYAELQRGHVRGKLVISLT